MEKFTNSKISGMGGEAALPRKNGELVFEMPWESRAFGLAVSLSDAGVVEWPEFRKALVTAIKVSERDKDGRSYYQQWLSALEKVALEKGARDGGEHERADELAGRGIETRARLEGFRGLGSIGW